MQKPTSFKIQSKSGNPGSKTILLIKLYSPRHRCDVDLSAWVLNCHCLFLDRIFHVEGRLSLDVFHYVLQVELHIPFNICFFACCDHFVLCSICTNTKFRCQNGGSETETNSLQVTSIVSYRNNAIWILCIANCIPVQSYQHIRKCFVKSVYQNLTGHGTTTKCIKITSCSGHFVHKRNRRMQPRFLSVVVVRVGSRSTHCSPNPNMGSDYARNKSGPRVPPGATPLSVIGR